MVLLFAARAADCVVRLHSVQHWRDMLFVRDPPFAEIAADRGGGNAAVARVRDYAAGVANGEQPAVAVVRHGMVSGYAVPVSIHAAGVAAEHMADERIAGGGATRKHDAGR